MPNASKTRTVILFLVLLVIIYSAISTKVVEYLITFYIWVIWLVMFILLFLSPQLFSPKYKEFFTDERNKVSLSKIQIFSWTILFVSAYACGTFYNFLMGAPPPEIPKELVYLMGISTTSFAAVPIIRSNNEKNEPDNNKSKIMYEGEERLVLYDYLEDPAKSKWTDIFYREEKKFSGKRLDMGKLQMFYLTLVLYLIYVINILGIFSNNEQILRLPTFDDGMILILGISHAGYLGAKKTVLKP